MTNNKPHITLDQIFTFSDFVAKNCARYPEMADELVHSGDIHRTYPADEYHRKIQTALSGVNDEDTLSRVLRRIRCREMIRIACRDIGGIADLTETTDDLSNFADAVIEHALSCLYTWHCAKFGIPTGKDGSQQHLVVVGMGKLGAWELNFSSDIDLIFAYPEPGQTLSTQHSALSTQHSLSNEDFFTRLCRKLLKIIGAKTVDGICFRVDTNLRPFGESGPLVMSFDAMDEYYHRQGREWERYAWIKARIVAGDKSAGNQLLKQMNPFIYRRYLDYGVYESIRDMKRQISNEVRRKGMEGNIKLGFGGIREIEFFGQIFQLLRGGVNPMLQERRIQNVLNILADENYITPAVRNELTQSYIFLRTAEHRLQEFADQQTHMLPSDPAAQKRLALSMNFSDWDAFAGQLSTYREIVHRHFNKLLELKDAEKPDETHENKLRYVWQNPIQDGQNKKILAETGFENPDDVLSLLKSLHKEPVILTLNVESRKCLDKLIPMVLKEVGKSEQPLSALNSVIELIKAIQRRTTYLSLLLENPAALSHLINLANASSWMLAFLKKHPVLLDELLVPHTLYAPPKRAELENELRHRLEHIPHDDFEYQLEVLRIFKQENILRVAAADITGALPLMKVSDHLSDIAETILHEVVSLSWRHLIEKHGVPDCSSISKPESGNKSKNKQNTCIEKGFAVIAYGKLGGFELSYDSDVDLVFLHAGTGVQTTGGERPIDTSHFFARLGQRVIHILTAHTGAGILYEADMRLRPSGSAGLLVSHIDSFREYQLENAWTWEKQAIIRARAIIGDTHLRNYFEDIRRQVLCQPRVKTELQKEVCEMRERMRQEFSRNDPEIFDLKQDPGGIVDIEFLVQYLVLLHACKHPELLTWTDNVRLLGTLAESGVIDGETAYFLRTAYLTLRTMGHRLSLQKQPAVIHDNRFDRLRKKVREIWESAFHICK